MFGYIMRRLAASALVMVLISMLVFALFFYGPSSPGQALCSGPRCTPERVEQINQLLGFNDPITQQYGEWAKGLVAGRDITFGSSPINCPAPCLGISYQDRLPVTSSIAEAFPKTLSLALGGAAIFLPLGVLLGTLAARRRGEATDRLLVGTSITLSSIPYFLVALLAYLYFIIIWGLLPSPDYTPLTENPLAWAGGLIVPWVVLGLFNSTAYARFSRGSMVESLSEDYVRTARAKGLRERTVVVRHGLRAAIVPILTIFGLDFASLLAGTVLTEQIFGIQGLGRLALASIAPKDFPTISATVLVAAFIVVTANLVVDILYSVIDPRVHLS